MMLGAKKLRARNDAPWAKNSGNARKERLVQAIKAFQRQSPENKELWGQYADAYLEGHRDPNRHEVQTLQEFVTQNQVSMVTTAAASFASNNVYLQQGAKSYNQGPHASMVDK